MVEQIKEFQTLIASFIALIGACIVVFTTRSQIKATEKQNEEKLNREIRGLATILATEAEICLRDAGSIASMIYKNPIAPILPDLDHRVFSEKLSSLGLLPGLLPNQIVYSYKKVRLLQDVAESRVKAINENDSTEQLPDDIAKLSTSTVDLAASTICELAILVPWLEHLAETGDTLSSEQALQKVDLSLERLDDIARELAIVKFQEFQHKNTVKSNA